MALIGFYTAASAQLTTQKELPLDSWEKTQTAASNDSWVPLGDLRPSERSGVIRIEVRYANPNISRRTAVTNYDLLRQEVATLTPQDRNWTALKKAISASNFSLDQDGGCEIHWGLYVYTKQGLARVISFQDKTAAPPGRDRPCGFLGIDSVYMSGPLPDLLESCGRRAP